MSQDRSVQLDGDKLGEGVDDGGLPGVGDYPPDTAQGVNDPNLVGDDDVAMREARIRSEELPGDGSEPPVGDILPPDGERPGRDDEHQLLAETTLGQDDTAPTPAEVDALHETE